MLKNVTIDLLSDGKPVTIPLHMSEKNVDQQTKRFIEIASYNPFDGQLHISLFRHFHGGKWTLRILQDVLEELSQPKIDLNIPRSREDLVPFFEHQYERHKELKDEEFRYPGDRSRLPI